VQNVQYTVGSWGPRTGGHGVARVDSDHAECTLQFLTPATYGVVRNTAITNTVATNDVRKLQTTGIENYKSPVVCNFVSSFVCNCVHAMTLW